MKPIIEELFFAKDEDLYFKEERESETSFALKKMWENKDTPKKNQMQRDSAEALISPLFSPSTVFHEADMGFPMVPPIETQELTEQWNPLTYNPMDMVAEKEKMFFSILQEDVLQKEEEPLVSLETPAVSRETTLWQNENNILPLQEIGVSYLGQDDKKEQNQLKQNYNDFSLLHKKEKEEVHIHNEIPQIRIEFSGKIDQNVDVSTLLQQVQKQIQEEMESSTDFTYAY